MWLEKCRGPKKPLEKGKINKGYGSIKGVLPKNIAKRSRPIHPGPFTPKSYAHPSEVPDGGRHPVVLPGESLVSGLEHMFQLDLIRPGSIQVAKPGCLVHVWVVCLDLAERKREKPSRNEPTWFMMRKAYILSYFCLASMH